MITGKDQLSETDLIAELEAIKRAEPHYRRCVWEPSHRNGPVHIQMQGKRAGYTNCGIILSLPALAKEVPHGRPSCIQCRTVPLREAHDQDPPAG